MSIGTAHDCCWVTRLADELSRPATFDEGVEAARNACAAGASLAAAVITAGAWYDNPFTGAAALSACMQRLRALPLELDAWRKALTPGPEHADGAPAVPGFGFVAPGREHEFFASLEACVRGDESARRGRFVLANQAAIAALAGPLNAAGLCALVFLDHDVEPDAAERQFWSLRIEVVLREGLAARRAGVSAIPFGGVRYAYEGELPPARRRDRRALLKRVGIDPDGEPCPTAGQGGA